MILGIYGAHGLAQEVNIIATKINEIEHRWTEIIYIDDINNLKEIDGQRVMRINDIVKLYEELEVTIAVGEPMLRNKLYERVKALNISLPILVHPGVYIDTTTKLGRGVTICEGVTITCNVSIGDNTFVHPHAVIGHDIKVGKHCVIGSNSQIGGASVLGDNVYMGFLSGVKEKISIGNDVICSAGAIVFRNLPDNVIAMGNPARIIRKNDEKKVFKS